MKQKNSIFISLLAIIFGLCYSCNEETLPTRDSIVYDKTKGPIITSNIDLETEMFVDSNAIWDVDINAYNGIDTIFLNDSVIHAFGDGQLKYNGIEITMPSQEEYEVKLSVKDEAGLETIHPPFTINVKGKPTIISNVDLKPVMFVDSKAIWDVDINAHNGIDTIFLNNSAIHTFGDGQFNHNGIEITMPDQEEYEVVLSVKDVFGFETTYPAFTLTAKGRITSPFMICDFTTAGATVIGKESERRPLFPKANAVDGGSLYSANAGWIDATMVSDLENQTTVRYGAPSMGTTNNADKWKHVSTFGAVAPNKEGNSVSALLVRHHFKDVAPDGNVGAIKWKPAPVFFLNKLVFDAPLLEPLVADLVASKRVFKIDIYVDTKSTADTDPNKKYNFDLTKHDMVALGMANVAKFNNTTSKGGERSGQDHGMVAYITQTDAWETLTFELDPSNTFVHTNTALPIGNNEIDMLTLFISAQTTKTGSVTNVVSNAKYYLSNLRVEKVD